MAASTALWSAVDVESFIYEYYDAWSGTDEDRMMSYYTEDVVLQIPGMLMEGKDAVREQFARPFITAFPGNRHLVKNMMFGPGVVVVEFSFEAQHKGPFAGHAATGARITLPGCGVYEYDAAKRQITAGRIYFDVGTLLQTITDALVDDREKAQEALRTNERNLSLITNVIPTFIHVLRADGSVLYVNQAVLGYTGLTLEDVQREDYRARFFHPEDVERLREERQEAFTRAAPFENEQRVLRKDGKYRWFLVRYNPLLDEQGRIDRWYVAATDIDDRKKAEEALRSSERNLSLMINVIPTVIAVLGTDGSMLYANQTALDFTGLTLEDVQKKDSRSRIFHPQDVERLHEERQAALTRGIPFENEQRVLAKDGKYRWFLIRYNPLLDEQGRIDRWYVAATDIEDRKRAEKALESNERNLRLIINTMPTLAWSAAPDGSVDFLNQRWLDYTGFSPEQGLGWGWTSAIHPRDLNRLADYWRSIMHTGEAGEIETRFRRFDGEYRWFLFRASAVRDESGTIVKWYGTNTDIDDRKRAEARVEQAYLRLAEAQQVSKTGSFITDLVADDHDWSEEAFRIFEFHPAAKVTVQMIRDRVHPED